MNIDEMVKKAADAAYHCEQARAYISLPAAETPEKNMASARWHLDAARAALQQSDTGE